jgi:hypothetical protein
MMLMMRMLDTGCVPSPNAKIMLLGAYITGQWRPWRRICHQLWRQLHVSRGCFDDMLVNVPVTSHD